MRVLPVKPNIDFDWYNPHLLQVSTGNIKLVSIYVFKAIEVFVMLLLRFVSSLITKSIVPSILSTIENSYTFYFSSCVIKKSPRTFFRPPHKSTSKEFNETGEKFGGRFCQKHGFGSACDLSSRFRKYNTTL